MAWSTIRKASDDDIAALARAAERFCKRHGIDTADDAEDPEFWIDCTLNPGSSCSRESEDTAKRLRPLWARIVRRTLGDSAEGIAYGYVGYHAD